MKNRNLYLIIVGWLMTVVIGGYYRCELDKAKARLVVMTDTHGALGDHITNRDFRCLLCQRLKHADACVCNSCLEESFQTVDDLQEAVDAVSSSLRRPVFGSATKLYQTAMSYIEKKDGIEGSQEFSDAVERNIVPFIDDLASIVAAIRYAENGRPGLEYGMMSDYAKNKTYSKQVGDCAKTVSNHYHLRWSVNSEYQQPVAVLKKNISALKLGITIIEGEVYPDSGQKLMLRLKKKIKVFYEHLLDNVGKLEDIELFMISLSDWFCKVGASNDPSGMNAHWLYNVWTYDRKIRDLSK